jgi:hypothetical protein
MTLRRFLLPAGLFALLCGTVFNVWSASVYITAKIKRVLVVADSLYGGCMAMLTVAPSSVPPGCSPNWVTFSGVGDLADPIRAYRVLDQAQSALSTDQSLMLQVTDEQRHNHSCFASRIDVLR